MEPIRILQSTCVPLAIDHVDTDQIIPARFLKATTREGFGENLFRDWRYHADGSPKKDFVLNQDTYQGEILLAGKNFGSGSSREHAAWAILDYGFRVVVSVKFADIFRNNALNNGLLPVEVPQSFFDHVLATVQANPGTRVELDLPRQEIRILSTGESCAFDINPYKKQCLLEGLDDMDYLLAMQEKIEAYEQANAK
jgi:3-isopropylmalate/(R)-2-methylmalate dehydratase small subunit